VASKEEIHKAEIVLAKMIQSAKARGLRPTTKTLYRNRDGVPCGPTTATQCCAMGAFRLDEPPDAHDGLPLSSFPWGVPWGVVEGNDGHPPILYKEGVLGYAVGAAFQHAMKR
jgi:hypothetical protein